MSHKGGVTQKNQTPDTHNNGNVRKTIPSSANPSTLLLPLDSHQIRFMTCLWGIIGHIPEGGGANLAPDTSWGNSSMDRKREPTRSGHITFDPDFIYKILWVTTGFPG